MALTSLGLLKIFNCKISLVKWHLIIKFRNEKKICSSLRETKKIVSLLKSFQLKEILIAVIILKRCINTN